MKTVTLNTHTTEAITIVITHKAKVIEYFRADWH
jgi:hypothetical protein